MPQDKVFTLYFISKNGEQPNFSPNSKKIVASKEQTLLGQSSKIKITIASGNNNYPDRTFFIFYISPSCETQLASILDIIQQNAEYLRLNKDKQEYDKFSKLEKTLNGAGYSIHSEKTSNSTHRYATDPGRRKRTLSSTSLRDIPEANDNKGKGVTRSATFNNLRNPSFCQGSIASSYPSTSSLYNDDPLIDSNNHRLARELAHAQQENSVLKEQLQTEKIAKDDAVRAQQEAEGNIKTLKEQLQKAQTEADARAGTAAATATIATDAKTVAEEKVATLTATLGRAIVAQAEAEAKANNLEAQLKTATDAKADAGKANETLQTELNNAKQAQETAEKENGTLKRQLQAAQTANEDRASTEAEVENLKEQLKKIQIEIQTVYGAKDGAKRAQKTAEIKMTAAKENQRKLETRLSEQKETFEKEIKTLECKQVELEKTIETLTTQLGLKQTKSQQKVAEELLTLQAELKKAQQAQTEAERKYKQAQEALEKLQQTKDNVDEQVTTLQEQLAAETAKAKQAQQDLEKLQQTKGTVDEQVTNLQERLAAETKAKETAQEALEKLQKTKGNVDEQVTNLQEQLAAEKEKVVDLETKLREATENKERAEAEVEDLEAKLKKDEAQVTKLTEELSRATKAKDDAEATAKTANEDKEKAEAETRQATKAQQKAEAQVKGLTEGFISAQQEAEQALKAEINELKAQLSEQKDFQLFLQPLQRELEQHADLLKQNNSSLAQNKASMILDLSEALKLFATKNSNREESLGQLKQKINDSRETLEQHRNISSRLLCYMFRSKRPVFKTASARLLYNIEKTISPFDANQSLVESSNTTEATRPKNNGASWITDSILSHRHR
ncbi:hypothetical protein [Rickettsiella endosymbiont of Dermanyssus gallinae]|uniref:hypothetical protein n=1 Tax=Rickettsiella endosymbiont of Dermanyssus gallinae TaxID=2856608 RepID=UPI001C52AF7E|nr:hypothetical protein [Rickettsiella endosymbiont of Dermanyssus gallinae]